MLGIRSILNKSYLPFSLRQQISKRPYPIDALHRYRFMPYSVHLANRRQILHHFHLPVINNAQFFPIWDKTGEKSYTEKGRLLLPGSTALCRFKDSSFFSCI